jgi:hypothetical protein
MKQYRYTTENFVISGDDGATDDAVMDTADLSRIRKLAGIVESSMNSSEQSDGSTSPLTSNFNQQRKLERDNNIQPGTDEWFALWARRDMPGLPNN